MTLWNSNQSRPPQTWTQYNKNPVSRFPCVSTKQTLLNLHCIYGKLGPNELNDNEMKNETSLWPFFPVQLLHETNWGRHDGSRRRQHSVHIQSNCKNRPHHHEQGASFCWWMQRLAQEASAQENLGKLQTDFWLSPPRPNWFLAKPTKTYKNYPSQQIPRGTKTRPTLLAKIPPVATFGVIRLKH